MEKKKRIKAKVSVAVEIEVSDRWGDDTTIAQIRRQAVDSVRNDLHHLLTAAKGGNVDGISARAGYTVERIRGTRVLSVNILETED